VQLAGGKTDVLDDVSANGVELQPQDLQPRPPGSSDRRLAILRRGQPRVDHSLCVADPLIRREGKTKAASATGLNGAKTAN
jgi:hypothetical protein